MQHEGTTSSSDSMQWRWDVYLVQLVVVTIIEWNKSNKRNHASQQPPHFWQFTRASGHVSKAVASLGINRANPSATAVGLELSSLPDVGFTSDIEMPQLLLILEAGFVGFRKHDIVW